MKTTKKTRIYLFSLGRLFFGTLELASLRIFDPATPNCSQLQPHYLALTKKIFSQFGQELSRAPSHASDWKRQKKRKIAFFRPWETPDPKFNPGVEFCAQKYGLDPFFSISFILKILTNARFRRINLKVLMPFHFSLQVSFLTASEAKSGSY